MSYLDRLHPFCSFCYFFFLILIAMFTRNPLIILLCYLSAVVLCALLIGFRKLLSSLAMSVPLMLMIALTNPLFVHAGKTPLFFLNDNPVTLEAIVYGIFASMMILSVFYLFRCYSRVMTSDKFLYLFGRALPKLSLLLSMALAFVPRMKRSYHEIDEAQKALGIYATKSYADQIRSKMRVLSILLTSCLETSVETADSMRARGYGLPGRTSYAIYRFRGTDAVYLALTFAFGVPSVLLIAFGAGEVSYYPVLNLFPSSWQSILLYALVGCLAFLSVVSEIKETIVWRCLRSGI